MAAVNSMVRGVAEITTRLDPDGIKVRFFNFKGDGHLNNIQTTERVDEIFSGIEFNGLYTRIGTEMRRKILEPLLFAKIRGGCFERPLLITTITDGEVQIENSRLCTV